MPILPSAPILLDVKRGCQSGCGLRCVSVELVVELVDVDIEVVDVCTGGTVGIAGDVSS
jgi:hypothetical protein